MSPCAQAPTSELISHDELLRLAHYDAESGLFTARVQRGRRITVGSILGWIEAQGYRRIKIKGRVYQAGRLAWFYETGNWPVAQIDHVNTIRDDNRFHNLREATREQNMANQVKRPGLSSSLKGVSWDRLHRRWAACISIDNKKKHLGYFDTEAGAHAAYCDAARIRSGQFARAA